jgi:hypothetical protein
VNDLPADGLGVHRSRVLVQHQGSHHAEAFALARVRVSGDSDDDPCAVIGEWDVVVSDDLLEFLHDCSFRVVVLIIARVILARPKKERALVIGPFLFFSHLVAIDDVEEFAIDSVLLDLLVDAVHGLLPLP